MDINAEVEKGDLFELYNFLKEKGIPADLSENISGWSVVAMPEGYIERAKVVVQDKNLIIKILDPYDFVIAKLRRGTQEDALFVAKKFNLNSEKILKYGELAIKGSIKDTALLNFKRGKLKLKLKVIPAFTGKEYLSIDEILKDKIAKKLLWAEILFNDKINWENIRIK